MVERSGTRFSVAVASLSVLMILVGVTVASQEKSPVYSASVNLVAMTVTIQTAHGKYVEGLTSSQVQVFDEGAAEPIAIFDAGNVPLDLVMLLDTSSSMNARLPIMKTAASRIMGTLRHNDRATLVTFGERTTIVQPFTSDHAILNTALGKLECSGSTSLYDAMYIALHEFGARATDVRRRAIVVMTDGDDTASLTSFDTLLDAARRRTVATYIVRLLATAEKPDRFAQANYELGALATDTGAKSFTAEGIEATDTVVSQIAGDLRHQYLIGFAPPGDSSGRFRRVSVKVDVPDVVVRARSGYFAASP